MGKKEELNQFPPTKFLVVLNKMYKSIFDPILKNIKDLGLNETEFLILYALVANGPLTIQDIGDRIFMTSGSMTYTIDKLEKKGLLKRVRSEEDRRKIYIELTEEGQKFWDNIFARHTGFLANLFSVIPKEELIELTDTMKDVGKRISKKE